MLELEPELELELESQSQSPALRLVWKISEPEPTQQGSRLRNTGSKNNILRLVKFTLLESNPNFRDKTWNVEENMKYST